VLLHRRGQRRGDRPLNILQATLLAMRRAVEGLRLLPQRVLVDGNRVPVLKVPVEAIVKGDAKVAAISAASILAKVHRDRLCQRCTMPTRLRLRRHKGYPTPSTWRAARAWRLRGAPPQLRAGAMAEAGRLCARRSTR
jgi:ribonuclease HII